MIQCKSNYNAWFKVIAITVLCLFTLNNLVWANPDIFQKNSPYITNDQNLAAMLGSVETSILTTVKAYVDSLGVKFFTESERHIFSKGPRGEWIYLDSYPEIPANWEGDNFILNCRLGSATREVIVTPDGNVSLREKADKQKEVVENIIDAAKAREPEQPPRADLDHKQPSYLVHYFEQGEERPLVRGLMSPLVLPHEIGNLIQALITGRWKDIKEPSWVNLFHGWVYKNKAPPCVGGILTSILTGVISLLFTNKFLMFYGMINLIYAGMEITYFLIREARSLKITGFGMDFASRSPARKEINAVDTNKPDWFQEAFWRCAAAKVKSEKVKRNRINAEDWYYGATVIPWYERQINKLKRKLSEEEINTSLLKILLRVKKVQLSRFSSAEERETADLVKQQAFGIYFEVNTKRVNINPVFEYNPLTKTWEIDGKVTYIWENLLKEDADVVVEAYKKAALAEAQGKPEAADLKAEASILMEIAGKRLEEAKARLYSLTIDQGNKGPVTLLPGFAVLAFGGDELFSMYTLGIVFGILLAVMILRWTYDTGRIQRFMNKHPRVKGVLGSMFGADPEEQEISDILFRNAPVPFHVLDHEGRIIMVDQKWLETFGYKLHEVRGRRIFDFIIPEQRENAEQRFKTRIRIHQIKQLPGTKKLSTSSYAALAKELAITHMPERKDKDGLKDKDRIYLSKDGRKIIAKTDDTITETKVITSFLDITDLRKAEDDKADIAQRDPITGLYNLRHLRAELEEAIARSEITRKAFSLLLISLNNYEEIKKDTNRTFAAELAKALGGQIQECLPGEENGDAYTLAYIDSGLYAVIVRGNGKETIQEKIRTLSRKIFRSLKHNVSCGGEDYTYRGSVSMGAAVVPDDGNTEGELINNAGVALQESKKRKSGSIVFCDPDLKQEDMRQRHLANRLPQVLYDLGANGFELHYQPQVNLKTGKMESVEALIRWNDPVLGKVPPSMIIDMAEARGWIGCITEWVLRKSCEQAFIWQKAGYKIRVAVNISPSDLERQDAGLLATIEEVFERIKSNSGEPGFDPKLLVLEITERVMVENPEQALQTMQTLRQPGISIHIDDFGTGTSGLKLLGDLPFVDVLKLDKSFLGRVGNDPSKANPEHAKLIQAIINMAHEMGKKVVAEGVETKEQLEFVKALGCDIAQGYYPEEGLGAAMPAAELGKRLSLFADTTDEGGTTLGDYGFLVLAIIGSTLISKWLGLIVGLLAICALVNFIAGADRTEPSGGISLRSFIFWVLVGIFAAGSAFAQVPGGENFSGALFLSSVTDFLWDNLVWVIITAVEIVGFGIAAFFLVWRYKYPVNWYLRKLKRGEFMHTRIYAIKQLGKLGDRRAVKPLVELMKNDRDPWTEDLELRAVAADALLWIGDVETLKKEFGEDYREILFAYIETYNDFKGYMLSLERDHIVRNEFERVQKEFGVHAIPALLNAMANGYDSAGISLIEIGEPAVEPLIEAFLDFPFVHPIFGPIPPSYNLSPREKELREYRIRRAQSAIRVLGEIGDPRAIGPIKNMLLYLAKDFYDPRVTAVKALGKIGLSIKEKPRASEKYPADKMLDTVITTLKVVLRGSVRPPTSFEMDMMDRMEPIRIEPDASERVRQEAADYLGKIGGEKAFNALYEAFYDDEHQFVRRDAVQGMGEIGDEKAIGPMRAALKEADKGMRLDAVKALGKIGGSEAFKLLCGVFNDREDGVRGEAARSLLKFEAEALVKEFGPDFKKLLQTHICVEESDWKTLETYGRSAIPALRACLTDTLVRNYFGAVEALGKVNVPPEEVIPILVSQMELKGDKYAGNRQIVIKTLGTIDAPRTIPILVSALADENAAVRQTAAIALGQKAERLAAMSIEMTTTNRKVIWALAKILKEDNDPNARISAAQSLTQLALAFKKRMGHSEERVKRIKQMRHTWGSQEKDPADLAVNMLTSMTVLAKDTGVRVAVINGLGEIGDPYSFTSKALLDRLESNYGNDSYWIHVASARALLRINHVEFLRENFGDDYEARLNAYDLIEQKGWQELEKMGEYALPALFDAMGSGVQSSYASSYAANETAEKILGSSRISAEMFREIVRAIRHFHLIVLIHKNNPGLFNGSPLLKKLLEKIQFDLENKPEEERKKLLMQISNDITNYASEFDLEQNLDAVYESMYSLYIWVHDNLHLCLSSLINIGLKIDDISDLIKTLHINNPLTRIIRMLGESEVIIDGYQDVVSTVIAQGKFGHLYKLILQVAREKQRAAPQEVAGILGILREYNNRMQLAEWSDEAWTTFSRYVQEYYNSGFKVITSILFKYFTAHRNDKLKLDGLKVDIDKEMNNIGWGNYWGLSKKFKRKYNLTTADEIALMARFLQISNFSIKDYESIYESVKSSLQKKKPGKWQEEIPSSLRTLFSLKGTKPQTAYRPKDENEVKSLGELMNRLSSYASGSGLSMEDVLEMDLSKQKEEIKPVIVRSALSEEERAYFQSIPEKAPERRAWLSRWYTLMADTLKLDQRAVLERKIEGLIKRRSAEPGSLEDMLNKTGIRLVDISRMDKLFKVDPDLRKIISERKYEELEGYFLRKWFIQMKYEDVKDPSIFNAWLERGFKKFISKMPHEINKARKKRREKEIEVKVDERKIRAALETARTQYLENWRQFLSKRLSGRLVRIFSEDIGSVQRHLESFTEESVSSEENLYVGLFDDLLHLAGEFMMSGVCTRGDRPRQIAKGHAEGYHFATIALKDDLGRVLGFSQAQIIKTPVTGKEDRENQGYRAIALTGINLSEKQLPIERERAVMAIIKAAQLLAEKAGLQGAVVVESTSIRSNQGEVNGIIDTLAQKGCLQRAKLSGKVHLSKRGLNLTVFAYSYRDVYFVDRVPGIELVPASNEERKEEQEKHEELLEKKHIEFFDRLGHIVQGKELTGEAATLLKEKMEKVLGTMPEDAIELVRMNMSLSGQAFNVIYEPTFAESKVVHSKKEIVLYLGKDVLYSEGKTEELGLREALAEAIASFMVEDYERLKEAGQTDENAFFKLETIKALLNWQAHARLYHRFIHKYSWDTKNYWSEKTPDEQEILASRYREDLDRFTDGWSRIRQHNIFMNVMDDADPMAMVFNYVHMLSKDPGMTEKDIYRLIMDVSHTGVRDKVSIARLRNVLKEFFFYGKVSIRKVDGKVDKKKKFDHFDDTAKIDQLKDILLTTGDINTFYRTLRSVLEMMLPLDEKSAEKDISAVFEKFGEKVLTSDDREGTITGIVREALVRRLGAAAFTSLTEHLSANRGYKDIPYIEICPRELAEGTDADEYEFLRYVPDIDGTYDLFSGEEKAPGDRDWVLGLFPVKAAMGEDADGRGGHGTANPDAGFTPVWAMAGLASVTGLFAAIRGSLSFYFPLFVDAVKAYPVWSGAVFVSAVILARLIRTGLVHFVIWWGFSIFTDEKIRQIRILGFLGGPKAVRTLIGFLEDDSMWGSIEQRAAAARALLRINDRKRMKKKFGSDYKAVLSAFVHMGNEDEEKMIALGKSAIPAAAMALNKGPGAPRYEPNMPAIRVLSAIGGPSEIRDLCRSFKSKYIHLHKHFEDFAGLLLEKGDPVILREEFSDDYEQVLKAYIFAEERKWDELEKLGKHATPVLVRILRTNTGREMNTSLIRTVAGIISRIKDPGAMEDAVGYIILILSKFWEPAGMFLRHSHERARDLEEALITLGNPAVIPVLSVLLDERTSVDFRHSAITILSGIDDPGALGGLDHALRHMYAGFRQAAIAGIEGKGEAARAILPTIVNALDDNDKEVRLGAIRAVGNAGSIPEMERLEKFLQDREMNMRKTAAEALIKIYRRSFHKLELVHIEPRLQAYISAGEGDWEKVRSFGKYAFPCLRACMLDTEWENYKAALKCIGKMGPDAREFVPYLVTRIPTLKEDKYSGNRQVIAEALGGLRDQRASDVLVGCLSDKYPGVMAAAAKALGKIKVPRASPKLLELLGSAKNEVRASAAQALLEIDEQGLLRNKLGESYKNVLNAYVLVGEKKWDEAVKLAGDAIPAVVAADKGSDYYFRAKARETFWNILMISKISPELFQKVMSTRPSFLMLVALYRKNSEYFKEHSNLNKLLRKINEELATHPEEQREALVKQFSNPIEGYVKAFTFEGNTEDIYGNILSLLNIVHDNLSLCLESLKNAGLKIEDIHELSRVLPLNNPLTRIIRMLGERESTIGGHIGIVGLLIKEGNFQNLYDLILDIAKEKQRAAPQEVEGILEILEDYHGKGLLDKWDENEWKAFTRDIQEYYNNGFKVITALLFSYFREHKDETAALVSLKEDIEKELKNIAWGNFWGLSDKFKKKYKLTTIDEIALIAKYVRIKNLSGRDYTSAYDDVRLVLRKKTPEKWQAELPDELRTLFTSKGTKTYTVYRPQKEGDHQRLADLMSRLSSYVSENDLALDDLLEMIFSGEEEKAKRLVLKLTLAWDEKTYLKEMPHSHQGEREWLSRWHTFLADTLKLDHKPALEKIIYAALANGSYDIKGLEEKLGAFGFKLIRLSKIKKLFEVDPDLENIIREEEYSKLDDYFRRKWFARICYEDILNEDGFNEWISGGFKKFMARISSKTGMPLEAIDKEKIRKALNAAREKYLSDRQEIIVLRTKQLIPRITDRLLKFFSKDIVSIKEQLNSYKEESISSKDNIYVGLFDDQLHITGEFMMSGVCTWVDRSRQVREGGKEGYHFAVIALKDASGKVLGISQVQVLKTPLKGAVDNESMGYRVLSLTGINLSEKKLPIEREKAVLTILKAAYLLARNAGLQAAVIPVEGIIHSNQNDVHNVLVDLENKGILKRGNLSSDVVLSKTGFSYTYMGVYIINEIPGINLTSPAEDAPKTEYERQDELMEKKHIEFCGHLGHIISGKELSENDAVLLKEDIEKVFNDMPQDVIEDLKLNMSFNETSFSVVYEPSLAESNVTRTEKEVIVYLGKDVLYGKGKVELLALKDILAEAVVCFLLEDYEKLKEESRTDENAFLKIENIKMLLNRRSHVQLYHRFINRYAWTPENYWSEKTPEEQKRREELYRRDLDGFTRNRQNIRQHNIFMNIMDGADPMALVFNYVHILSKDPATTDKDIHRLINEISRVNVSGKVSIARVRNILKEFYFDGKVNIKQADGNVASKEKFNDLDNSERLAEMRDVLLATRDINTFYRTLRLVFESMLPLGDDALKKDVGMVFEKFGNKILDSEDREEALRAVIKEVLVRRIGSAAFTSLTEHLSANRGYKDIPYIEICPRELAEGTDADEYEFLRYVPDVDGTYDLFAGEEKAPEDRDWVLGLFPVKAAPGEDDDDKGGHGTALRDFGMLVVATAGASSISPWLGIVVGILACCVVVGHMTDMLGPSPAPQGAPSTGAGVNNERPPAPAGTRQIFEGSMSFGRVVSRLPDFIAKYILMFKRNSIQKKIRKTGIRWKKKNRALLPYGLEKELSVLIKDGKRRPGMEAPQVAAFEVAAMLNSELGFIIEKLLTNASDACMRKMNVDPDSSAKIDVRIFTAQSDLVIEITDNGPGLIDEAGSPLIRTLVKCHNGKVEWNNIASPDGVIEGAKATITLPVREIVGVPDRPASDTIDPRFTSSGSQDALNEARVQEILKKLGFVPREGETFRYIVYEPRLKQISGQLTPTDYSALFDYFWNRNGTGLLFPEELKAKLILAWWNLPKCHMSFILNGHPDGGVIAKLLEMKIVTNDKEEQFLWELFRIRAPEWSNRDLTELREKAPRMMDEIDMEIGRAKRPVRVLDLGCGSEGRAVRDLKSYYGDKIEAFGVDLQTYDENIEGVTLKPANIRNLPFEDNSFDLIYEYLALDALTGEPLKRSISEAMRVLAPGGKFMISQSINQEEIYTILDRLGIDHEITGDTPFIIIKKAASERSTLAAENGSISARAEPTIDELPSGIEEVIFNGERAGPETARQKISESVQGRVIFNAKIEEKRLIFGFAPEDSEHAHSGIKDPGFGFGVFRGEIAKGEITLLLGGLDKLLSSKGDRKFRDDYIRIARFFVENGFPRFFPLDGITVQALERFEVFEKVPKTVGEVASEPLSKELSLLAIRVCKFQRQKDRIESPAGKELQDFIYKLNPHMQSAMKKDLFSVYPFTCAIAAKAAKRIIETKFGDVFDVSMRFGNFVTKVGPHVWLVITDKKTGEKYYLSFTDGQFVDFPLGDKQIVFFEKPVTSPAYQEWYEANGLEYATFKQIRDDSYVENTLGMVEAEDQPAAKKKLAIDGKSATRKTKALLEELASIPELGLEADDGRWTGDDEQGATKELNSFLPLPILGFIDARILWAVVAALLFVVGIRIIWNEFKYAWSANSYREELKEKWSLESFFESKKKYDRWRKEQASREDGFVIEPLLDRLKELEKEVLESKESFHDVFEDLALKTYLLIRKEGSFTVDEWLDWIDGYIDIRAAILDNLIAVGERDVRRLQLALKSSMVTDITERVFSDRLAEANTKLTIYKQLRDHLRSIDVRYALKIMDHLENRPGSFPGIVKFVDAEDPENVPLWRWQYLHPGKMPREKAAGGQTPADAPVPGKEPVRAANIADGWHCLAEMLEERLKGRQDSLRVLIWGYPGTGKSTIAEMIGKYGIGNISPDEVDVYVETGFIPILPEYRDSGKKLVIADGCDAPRWFKQHGMTPDVLVLFHIDKNGDMNAEALAHSPITRKAFYNVFKDDLGKDPHDPSTWDIIINTAGEDTLMALALDLKAQFAPADPGMSGPKSAGENEDKTEKTSEIPDNDEQKILRDLTDLEQLPLSLLELLISLKFNKEVVLVFDESIGKLHDGKPLKKFMEAIEILKKNKRYEAILGRLKDPILVPVDRISAEAGKYAGRANTEVFVFAKDEARENLKGLEGAGQVHSAFINENSMSQNAYYPLAEIVIITLAQSIAPATINGKITTALKAAGLEIMLGDINIESIAKEGSSLFFTLLPDAREYDHQELLQRYASFKRFLKAA